MKRVLFAMVVFVLWGTAAFSEPAAVTEDSAYTLQVGAFVRQSTAAKFASGLEEKGVAPYVTSNSKGLFVVRVGGFATREEARQAAAGWKSEGVLVDSLIVKTTVSQGNQVVAHPQASMTPEPASQAVALSPEEAATEATEAAETVSTGSLSPEMADQAGAVGSKLAGAVLEILARQSAGHQSPGFQAARIALDYLGVKYRLGGMSRETGMDCSGFVKTVYALCDIDLPRTSRDQFRQGRAVERGELTAGDLVFFGLNNRVNHVGIYLAEGMFIHAPRSREIIRISNLGERSFLRRFLGGRRLLFDN